MCHERKKKNNLTNHMFLFINKGRSRKNTSRDLNAAPQEEFLARDVFFSLTTTSVVKASSSFHITKN